MNQFEEFELVNEFALESIQNLEDKYLELLREEEVEFLSNKYRDSCVMYLEDQKMEQTFKIPYMTLHRDDVREFYEDVDKLSDE